MVCQRSTSIQRPNIRPSYHIHRCCTTWIHRHISKQTIVIQVVIGCQFVNTLCSTHQTIKARCPTLTRHIHVYLHVWTFRIVHYMGNVVVISLRLPRLHQPFLPLSPVRQRRDESLSFCHIHVQRGITYVGSTVEDKSSLYGILLGESETEIIEGINFLELREIDFTTTTLLVVVCVTIKDATVGVKRLGRYRSISTIHLQMAVSLITNISTSMEGITIKSCLP